MKPLKRETHGHLQCYRAGGCRCDECRRAHREYTLAAFRKMRASVSERPERVPHGTVGGYTNWGCRCDSCTAANSAACAAYYRRTRAAS